MKYAILIALALATGIAPAVEAAGRDGDHDRHFARSSERGDHGRAEHRRGRYDDRGDRGRHDNRGRHVRHDRYVVPAYSQHAPVWRDHRYAQRPSWQYRAPQARFSVSRYVHPRGYQARHWRSGQYLPVAYRGSSYVLDHRHYRLPPPPYGYHYIRVDNNAVLTAIATGLIADVMFDLFSN